MATYNIKNYKMLEKYMEKALIQGLEYCSWRAENMLKSLVQERLYKTQPKEYERTMELLNSISHSSVVKSGDTYMCKIYYDTDKIKSYPREESGLYTYKWGQHTSFSDKDVSAFIPLWIEEGTNNKYYSHEGTDSVEDTRRWLEDNYNKLFNLMLQSRYSKK